MEKKFKVRINFLICCVILIGFVAVGITSYNTYSKVIKDDILNISKLTSTGIYSDIRGELTKPIFVSLTMANDSFLKTWLKDEAAGNLSAGHAQALINYLLGIKEKYGYNSVFLVSEATQNYYYFKGLNKVISPSDDHDQWYYTFLKTNKLYDLDVDTDQANRDRLTVFINCRIQDENGKLLGVTGVGLELDQVQSLLRSFENDFSLEATLFNQDGIVQVSSDSNDIEKKNVFDLSALSANKDKIIGSNSMQIFQYNDGKSDGYLITRYIEDMDWYLLIKKDTSVLTQSFYVQLISDFIILAGVVLIVLLIVDRLIRRNEKILNKMARTDSLSDLPNRRSFNEALSSAMKEPRNAKSFFVFVFDIDNFKIINDIHGHLIGDQIIRQIGSAASEVFSKEAVFRWGGDEFAGFISGEFGDAKKMVERFFIRISEDKDLKAYKITVSFGAANLSPEDTTNTLLYRADQALYRAKESGKDRYVFIETP